MKLQRIALCLIVFASMDSWADPLSGSCRIRILKLPSAEEKILEHPDHILREYSPNLRVLSMPDARTADHEIAAARRIARDMPDKKFLLAAEMRGFKSGIPVFDGVIYGSDGKAERNFTLKSIMLDESTSDNLNKSFKSASDFAKYKLNTFYGSDWMAKRGFIYSNERYRAEPGNKFNHGSNEFINNFAELFGIAGGNKRPSSIVIDFYSKDPAKAQSVKMTLVENTTDNGAKAPFIEISAQGFSSRQISVEALQNTLRNNPDISSYILTGPTGTFEITRDSLTQHPQQ